MPPIKRSTTILKVPFLHNRTTGVVGRGVIPPENIEKLQHVDVKESTLNNIREALKDFIVDIDTVFLDPQNAREHPERNLDAIKESLVKYGQIKPIIVRKGPNTVVAGNGTLTAAKALGWTKIAAIFHDLTELEHLGYGIADNRTAELAKWNTKVLATLESLLVKEGEPVIGWSDEEVAVIRAAEFQRAAITDGSSNGQGESKPKGGKDELNELIKQNLLFSFTPDQMDTVDEAIKRLRSIKVGRSKLDDESECIKLICEAWLDAVNGGLI